MAPQSELPIRSFPVANWVIIGQRAAASRRAASVSVSDVAEQIGVEEARLLGFEAGEPTLSAFEVRELARHLDTTPGTWLCGDEDALFRGKDRKAAQEAREIGIALMTEFLAAEALVG
jgi:transcriptional regulator with XRE-family HTH domain